MKTFATLVGITVALTITGCVLSPQDSVQTSGIGFPPAQPVTNQIPSVGIPSATSVAGQLPSVGSVAGMTGNVASASPVATQIPSLVSILVQQLGITPQQATGGAGSIFSIAQQSMPANKFGLVSKAVPGMDQLLAAAPNSGTTSLMGSAASALGGGSLSNMATLVSSFNSLGMSSSMMNQFIPVILQYMQSQGSGSAMSLLQGALML